MVANLSDYPIRTSPTPWLVAGCRRRVHGIGSRPVPQVRQGRLLVEGMRLPAYAFPTSPLDPPCPWARDRPTAQGTRGTTQGTCYTGCPYSSSARADVPPKYNPLIMPTAIFQGQGCGSVSGFSDSEINSPQHGLHSSAKSRAVCLRHGVEGYPQVHSAARGARGAVLFTPCRGVQGASGKCWLRMG